MASKKRERQRLNRIAGSPFRIVVCAYPDRSITPVLPLLKAALLYGDEVVLHSPLASMPGGVSAIAHGDQRTFFEVALELAPKASPDLSKTLDDLDAKFGVGQSRKVILALLDPRSPARAWLAKLAPELRSEIAELERGRLTNIREELVEVSEKQILDAGFSDLGPAFDAEVLRICPISIDSADFEDRYLNQLQGLLSDPTTYPVFDEKMGDFVRVAVDAHRLDIAGYKARRGPSASVSERFLARLPTFPAAKVDEIIDIRADLRHPLFRFRRELQQVVAEMELSPWDVQFEHSVQAAWVDRVAPALLEIEELSQERRLVLNYGPEALGTLVTAGSMFAGMNMITAGLIAGGAGAAGGVAAAAATGALKHRAYVRKIRTNPYFFVFDTEQRLASTVRASAA
jgi:hypothetical protein